MIVRLLDLALTWAALLYLAFCVAVVVVLGLLLAVESVRKPLVRRWPC